MGYDFFFFGWKIFPLRKRNLPHQSFNIFFRVLNVTRKDLFFSNQVLVKIYNIIRVLFLHERILRFTGIDMLFR